MIVVRAFSWRPAANFGWAPRKGRASSLDVARNFTLGTAERRPAREGHYTIFRKSPENSSSRFSIKFSSASSLSSRLRLSILQMLPAPCRQLDGGSYAQRHSYRHRGAGRGHLEPAGGDAAGRCLARAGRATRGVAVDQRVRTDAAGHRFAGAANPGPYDGLLRPRRRDAASAQA